MSWLARFALLNEVRLQDLVTLSDHVAGRFRPLSIGELRLRPNHARPNRSVGCEVAPVERDPVPELAAQQLIDGHAKPLGFDVVERQVDCGQYLDPLRDPRSAAIPRPFVEELDPARVAADERAAHDPQRRGERGRRVPVVGLRPPDDALVRGDLHEAELAQAAVAGQGLDGGDLHDAASHPALPLR